MDEIEIRNEQEYQDSLELLENAKRMVGNADIHPMKPLIGALVRATLRYDLFIRGDE